MTTHIIDNEPEDDRVEISVGTLKLLADPTRLRILWALLHGEHPVGELAEHLGANSSAVSQHLAKLRLGRLVTTRRQGTHIYYLADNPHLRRLVKEILFHSDHLLEESVTDRARPASRSKSSSRRSKLGRRGRPTASSL